MLNPPPAIPAFAAAFLTFIGMATALQIGRGFGAPLSVTRDWSIAASLLASMCVIRGLEVLAILPQYAQLVAALGDALLVAAAGLHLRGYLDLITGAFIYNRRGWWASSGFWCVLGSIIAGLAYLDLSGNTLAGRGVARAATAAYYALAAIFGFRFRIEPLRKSQRDFSILFAAVALQFSTGATIHFWKIWKGIAVLPPEGVWIIFLLMVPAGWWSCYCGWKFFYDFSQWQTTQRHSAALVEEQERVSEEKHKRFARLLHDSVAGTSSSLRLHLESLPPDQTVSPETIDHLKSLSVELVNEVRLMIRHLEKPEDLGPGWIERCQSYLSILLASFKIDFLWDDKGLDPERKYPPLLVLDLPWILRELGHNTVRHSGADRVEVVLESNEQTMCIIFRDNGEGLSGKIDRLSGSGLRSIFQRVTGFGGQVDFESTPGNGLFIKLTLPLV